MIKLSNAINDVANTILRVGYRHTDGDIHQMLTEYYARRQNSPVRRDFSRAIEKVQKIVADNEVGAAKWRAENN